MLYRLSKVFFVLYLFYNGLFSKVVLDIPKLTPILGLSIIIFYTLHKIITRDYYISIPRPLLILFFFLLYALSVGVILSYDIPLLLSSLFTYAYTLILMLFIINASVTEKNNAFFVYVWLTYSIVYMITMLLWGYDYGRLVLTEGSNANGDALILLIGIFCALNTLKTNKFLHLVITLAVVGISIYTIMLTGSRKSFLAAILMVLLWFVFVFKDYWKILDLHKKLLAIITIVMSLPLIIMKSLPLFWESSIYLRLTERGVSLSDDATRNGMYNEALKFFIDNPIFGIGFNQFRVHSIYDTYSHSTYAEILSTTGLLGTLIYFAAYILIIYNLIKLYLKTKGTITAVRSIQYLILMFIMLLLGTGVIHFYSFRDNVVLAIIISFYYIEKEKMKNKEEAQDNIT